MPTDVKIKFENYSMNQDNPTVFIFAKNQVADFDALRHGTTMPNLGSAVGATAPAGVNIRFINNSRKPDRPDVFVFMRNNIASFDAMQDGIAWKVLENVSSGLHTTLFYPVETFVRATWGACNHTETLSATIGRSYTVEEQDVGIVLVETGPATQPNAIDIVNNANIDGGINAQVIKDGSVFMEKKGVANCQKASFALEHELCWGIASEIQEGQTLGSGVMETTNFVAQDLEGVTNAEVTLLDDEDGGYSLQVRAID